MNPLQYERVIVQDENNLSSSACVDVTSGDGLEVVSPIERSKDLHKCGEYGMFKGVSVILVGIVISFVAAIVLFRAEVWKLETEQSSQQSLSPVFYMDGSEITDFNTLLDLQILRGSSAELFLFVPSSVISNKKRYIYYEQVVEGIGSKEYYFDPALVTEQKIVEFEDFSPSLLVMKEVSLGHRSAGTGNFASAAITEFRRMRNSAFGSIFYCSTFSNQTSNTLTKLGWYPEINYAIPLSTIKDVVSIEIRAGYRHVDSLEKSLLTIRRNLVPLNANSTLDGTCEQKYSRRLYHPKSGFNFVSYMNESAGEYFEFSP